MPPLGQLPLARFCSFIWYYLTRHADETNRSKLRARLWQPPPDLAAPLPARSPWSPESETSAFQALKRGLHA